MEYDKDKVDEMVLSILYLTTSKEDYGFRAWKGMDWDAMNRLHEKGYISNPKSKAKSVVLTEEGVKLSEELFKKHFDLCKQLFYPQITQIIQIAQIFHLF